MDLQTAVELRTSGQLEEARDLLARLVAESPGDAQVLYQAAWVHDALGLEHEAVGFYRRAIEAGLEGEDLAGALVGLGSTLRCLGQYREAVHTLDRARRLFPGNRAIEVFLAMACHYAGRHGRCAEILLRNLAETTADPEILKYRRALLEYAPSMGDSWDSG